VSLASEDGNISPGLERSLGLVDDGSKLVTGCLWDACQDLLGGLEQKVSDEAANKEQKEELTGSCTSIHRLVLLLTNWPPENSLVSPPRVSVPAHLPEFSAAFISDSRLPLAACDAAAAAARSRGDVWNARGEMRSRR
jgi:hypothetical protein